MSNSNDLERLNEMKSSIGERDMKIWENVAYTMCLKKETDKLQNEIQRMETEVAEKKKENKIIEEQLEDLTNTLNVQRETLRASERSVALQNSLNESLRKEADDFKKKYDELLALFNYEFEDYRSIHENSSKSYQELKKLKVELKKHEVEKKILDEKIASFEESQLQYERIQEQIFHVTMVRLAEYYTLYHKNEAVKKLVEEKKKEEQQLLKEHFRLTEEAKQKTKQDLFRPKIGDKPKLEIQNTETLKEVKESDSEKFNKFLNEDYLPCSLTAIDSTPKNLKFNLDKSKVKVLDIKVVKPPVLKHLTTKPSIKVREKLENIMENTRKQVFKTKSLHPSHLDTKISVSQQKQSGSQTSQRESQSNPKPSESKVKPVVFENKSTPSPIKAVPFSVASTKPQLQSPVSKETTLVKPLEKTDQNLTAATMGLKIQEKKKDVATNSILKLSQEKGENVSKFFTPGSTKKKTVTFQNEPIKNKMQELTKFHLFSKEENPLSGTVVKDMNIFPKPFVFKNELPSKNDKKKKLGTTSVLAEARTEANISFPIETGQTDNATYGGDTFDKRQEETFDLLETSFSSVFGQGTENIRQPTEGPTFSFFGSQNKLNNPFGF